MSGTGVVIILIIIGLIIWGFVAAVRQQDHYNGLSRAQQKVYRKEQEHGATNPAMVCPHCQVKGKVHTKAESKKAGISGAKATGAILTGGLSVAATGLSRKEQGTRAFCRNCSTSWFF